MKTSAILIDDERKSLVTLRTKLQRFCPEVEIIAETQSPEEAIDFLINQPPDLVFLDIAMPEMSGFDVLSKIHNPDFEIIFVTAFDNYAIEAINHCAIGYLVKPVDNEDLKVAIAKALQNIKKKNGLKKNTTLIENLKIHRFQKKKIVIPVQEGLEFIEINSIVRCEGVDGYTKICLSTNKSILSSNSIGHFNDLLESEGFYLTHKSHLINLDYVAKYLNEGYVILTNNAEVPVSRSKRVEFVEWAKVRNLNPKNHFSDQGRAGKE